jgi:hypothetical protein
MEESGGLGASDALRDLRAQLGAHAFALEFDRMRDREWVTYPGTSSDGFREFLSDALPGWRSGQGSYTDIATICPPLGLCGANVAVGYVGQHTHHEVLFLDAWERTLEAVSVVLSWESYPVMVADKRPVYSYGGRGSWRCGEDGRGEWVQGGRSQVWASDGGNTWTPADPDPDQDPDPEEDDFAADWAPVGATVLEALGWATVDVSDSSGRVLWTLASDYVPAWLVQADGTVRESALLEYWEGEALEALEAPDPDAEDEWGDLETWKREAGDTLLF